MSCYNCNESKGRPSWSGGQNTWICPHCQQKWWCYNEHYNLWSEIEDEETWLNIQSGCPEPVVIGSPSLNFSLLSGEQEIKPAHKVCDNIVKAPKLTIAPVGPKKTETLVIQWFGECEQRHLAYHQFQFSVMANYHDSKFGGKATEFRVIYIGQAKKWPYPENGQYAMHSSVETVYQQHFNVTEKEIDNWQEIIFSPVPN